MPVDLSLDAAGALAAPESKTREYKRDLSSPENVMRSVVAFANSAGGQIVIGVDDDRRVVGVDDPLGEEERLANLIADWVDPALVPAIELATIAGQTVLVVNVALSGRRPHFVVKHGQRAAAYVRLGSTNREAEPGLVAELGRGARGEYFDKLPAPTQSLDDLDLAALERMLNRPLDNSALRTLSLVTADQGRLVATNGGVLLAGKWREELFPFAWAQCGRFRGEDRVDIYDQVEIHAHLPLMIGEMMAFLTKHASKGAEFGGLRRRDVWSIPVVALREIVTNAVAHALYAGAHSPIRVAFMDDRIEVDSPGGLMPGLTVEDITHGVSEIRNPVLARVFSEMNLMEQWGSGLRGVVKTLAAEGLPPPDFVELPGRLRVVVHIRNHRPMIAARPGTTRAEPSGVDLGASGGEWPGVAGSGQDGRAGGEDRGTPGEDSESGPPVGRYGRAVLASAAAGPIRRGELLAGAGLANSRTNDARYVAPLIRAGLLAMTLPEAPSSKNQRYKLTPTGRAALTRETIAVQAAT
ncbi:MAG: helix-turn-helix domain-containing protein [Bifidobacteriaceae bacterium]|nr:helix-turn-helix domain-containing protein [Bifidobacteriaceae bacterium]